MVLKPHLAAKRDKIRRGTHYKSGLGPNAAQVPIPTWAELMHDIVTHACETGWNRSAAKKLGPKSAHRVRPVK